ncbi:MAG: glutamine amidotransferase [Planctomycetota bacterium]
MNLPNAWLAESWFWPSLVLVLIGLVVATFAYRSTHGPIGLRVFLVAVKTLALLLLAICLLEPMVRFTRPEPGANLLLVLVDDSQSLQIKDKNETQSRSKKIADRVNKDARWINLLSEVFDVRRYQFDQSLRPVANFSQYQSDQRGTDLIGNLKLVSSRFSGRPAAGIVVLTDGNDLRDRNGRMNESLEESLDKLDWPQMPPIFPVVVGNQTPAADLGIDRVVSTQTNFETAPVSLDAEMTAHGFSGRKVAIELLDETGELIEKREVDAIEDGRKFKVRFQSKPQKQGVNVFQVRASLADGNNTQLDPKLSTEATLVNNQQSIVVNRGRGPFRVLYVCGRPNWELKFLNRAMQDDPEVDLVSLIRIAKRETKFAFRGRDGQQSNSLFRGFESQDDDTTEQHDEPVFLRIGTQDEDELRGGFPKSPEELFSYDGIILDDVEADFFNTDQQALLQEFISVRGGGLLMIGGQESFASGRYDQTSIGEMMPVYLDRLAPATRKIEYQMNLTREGWLQPWVRVRSTESAEKKRIQEMPPFRTVNRSNSIKPGATVLATVSGGQRTDIPALVIQPFGSGRVGALLIGDFWRWHMQTELTNNDQFKAWRQTLRWLVADVPRRVELDVQRSDDSLTANEIKVTVNDESFQPEDNANIELSVLTPEGSEIQLSTSATGQSGVYLSRFTGNQPGVYRAIAKVSASDGSEIEQREFGWVCQPDRDEFSALVPNRNLLETIAQRSGGKVFELSQLDQLPAELESSPVPITQERSLPWWHRWFVLAGALCLLVTEWGIRRWKGMP